MHHKRHASPNNRMKQLPVLWARLRIFKENVNVWLARIRPTSQRLDSCLSIDRLIGCLLRSQIQNASAVLSEFKRYFIASLSIVDALLCLTWCVCVKMSLKSAKAECLDFSPTFDSHRSRDKAGKENNNSIPVLSLVQFSRSPFVSFGTIKLGSSKSQLLRIENPTEDVPTTVVVDKISATKGFSVDRTSFTIQVLVNITVTALSWQLVSLTRQLWVITTNYKALGDPIKLNVQNKMIVRSHFISAYSEWVVTQCLHAKCIKMVFILSNHWKLSAVLPWCFVWSLFCSWQCILFFSLKIALS